MPSLMPENPNVVPRPETTRPYRSVSDLSDEQLIELANKKPSFLDKLKAMGLVMKVAGLKSLGVSPGGEFQQDPIGSSNVFTENTARGFVDNVLTAPGALAAGIPAGVEALGYGTYAKTQGEPFIGSTVDRFNQALSRNQQLWPVELLRSLPTSFDIEGAANALMPGVSFEEGRDLALESAIQRREAFPKSAAAGDLLSDGLTLAAGRIPAARTFASNPGFALRLPQAITQNPGLLRRADAILQSSFMRSLGHITGRTAEAGFEGAVLALLNEEDPMATAGYMAGVQAGGSLGLTFLQGLSAKNVWEFGGKVGAASFAAGALFQALETATPGGKDYILPNIEEGFEKVVYGSMIGITAGALGLGRLRGKDFEEFAKDMPIFADALTAIPRGSLASAVSDYADSTESERAVQRLMMLKMQEDPDFFGPTVKRRVVRSFYSEDAPSLKETINSLMVDRDFRRKLTEIQNEEMKPTGFERLMENTPTIPINRSAEGR